MTATKLLVAAGVIASLAGCGSSNNGPSHLNASPAVTLVIASNARYRQQLGTALNPLLASNRQLSTAMNVLDGSRSTNNAIKVGLKNAQTSVTSTQGAIGTITVPVTANTLSQQAAQALTQETGYLQVVSATFTDPTSASAALVQPSAANLTSALIPFNAQSSIFGVDNFYNWSQGATALAKKQQQPKVIIINNPAPTVVSPPVAPSPTQGPTQGGYGTDSQGYNYGPGCSDNPANSQPGCADSPSIPAGDPAVSYPNGITADRQTTSEGLAESVYANYTSDGPVTGWSSVTQQSYTFDCQTGGSGTTGYTICQGRAGNATLYLRWHQ
jgi:hypothetical protein